MGLLASIARDILPGVAQVGTAAALQSLFAPSTSDALRPVRLAGQTGLDFRGGGLFGRRQNNEFVVAPTDTRRAELVGQQRSAFQSQARDLTGLLNRVGPVFGDVTRARLAEIERARSRTIGDLRETLRRRRVLGSSFAQDAIARAEAEFAAQSADAAARSQLEELDIRTKLLAQRAQAEINASAAILDELNAQLGIASGSSVPMAQALANAARVEAGLLADNAAGLGTGFAPIALGVSNAVGRLL